MRRWGGGGNTLYANINKGTTVSITLKADKQLTTSEDWGTTPAAASDAISINATAGANTTNAENINIVVEKNKNSSTSNMPEGLSIGSESGGQNISVINNGIIGDTSGNASHTEISLNTTNNGEKHNLTLVNNGIFQSELRAGSSNATIINNATFNRAIGVNGLLKLINNKGATLSNVRVTGNTQGSFVHNKGGTIGINPSDYIRIGNDNTSEQDKKAYLIILNSDNGEIKSKIEAQGKQSTVEIQNFFGTLGAIDTSKAIQTTLKSLEGKITGDVKLGDNALVELAGTEVQKNFIVGNNSKKILFGENNTFKGDVNIGTKANVTIGKGTVFEAGTGNNTVLRIGSTVSNAQSNSHVVNMGIVKSHSMELKGIGNTLANQMGGSIEALKINGTGSVSNDRNSSIASLSVLSDTPNSTSTLSLNNYGNIGSLAFEVQNNQTNNIHIVNNMGLIEKITVGGGTNNTLRISGVYNVDMAKYNAVNGGGGITVSFSQPGSSLTVDLSSNARSGGRPYFMLSGLENHGVYDLTKFITSTQGQGQSGTINIKVDGQNMTNLANARPDLFTTPQSMYDIRIAGGRIYSRILPERSLGAFSMFHAVNSFNSQIFRANNMVDSAFEAVSYGEIGPMGYTKRAGIVKKDSKANNKHQSNEAGERKESLKKKGDGFISYLMPYYSYSSLSSSTLGTTGSSFGLVGGVTKELKNGVLFGIHMAFDSNMYGNSGDEMQMQGNSYMIGLHTKVPFISFQTSNVAITPYIKSHVNAMVSTNTYKLTPKLSNTIEDTAAVGGYSVDVGSGIDIHTDYGMIATEVSFMHQGVFTPNLSWNNFDISTNNQSVQTQNVLPLYALAHVRYAKSFNISEKIMLYPTLKAGVRAVLVGGSYNTMLTVQGTGNTASYNGITKLDVIAGFAEAGLGMRFTNDMALNLSYNGEFSKQVNNHGFYARFAWGF